MGVVLVTGCSSGIGLETALAFARTGSTVVATMRNPADDGPLRARAAAQGSELEILRLDVTRDDSVTSALDDIEQRHGPVDTLVNNAGIAPSGPLETMDLERARATLETNYWGPVRTMRAVLPSMRSRRSGTIVNVSSGAGRLPGLAYNSFYVSSKKALGALSESLAVEVAPFGIRVVCVEPAAFRTNMATNRPGGEIGEGPYAVAHAAWDANVKAAIEGGKDPGVVAEAILAAVSDPTTPTRVFVA
ncbi:MAG TPA: SDR family oxidoreductase [Acidimicrobiales bacterium]|jgi:NAD(P)-dependent dehydrogenase (short-subunit alcohol dehydrogenase family)